MIKMGIPLQTHRKGRKMGISAGTIFKWFNADIEDDSDDQGESCYGGQCIGIVLKVDGNDTSDIKREPVKSVKWWEMCQYHEKVDPIGTGPYTLEYIWQIGQLY
jgi:hypothetical protein